MQLWPLNVVFTVDAVRLMEVNPEPDFGRKTPPRTRLLSQESFMGWKDILINICNEQHPPSKKNILSSRSRLEAWSHFPHVKPCPLLTGGWLKDI